MPKYQAPVTPPACSKWRKENSPHFQPQIRPTKQPPFSKIRLPHQAYTMQLYENEAGLCESLIFLLLSSLFNSPRITCTVQQHSEMNSTNSILYSKSDPSYQSTLNRKPVKSLTGWATKTVTEIGGGSIASQEVAAWARLKGGNCSLRR